MKKNTKSDIDALKKEIPVLDEYMQKNIYGGCGNHERYRNGAKAYKYHQNSSENN